VLVIGSGEDPYRARFPSARNYIRLDIENVPGKVDVVADAAALPFAENAFDCVIATEVLEYVFQPARFVQEVYRVLGSGGTTVITVPFIFNYHNDYWRPTKRALLELFQSFVAVSVQAQGNRFVTIWDLITTSFWPHSIFLPLRIFSNLLYLIPARLVSGDISSSAPTGFAVTARKARAGDQRIGHVVEHSTEP
jgi:SAM-dependent methyltransferase